MSQRWSFLDSLFVSRGGFLYTMIVSKGGFLLSSSRVPGGGGGGMDEIDKLHNINSNVSFFNTVYIHPSSEVEGHDTHAGKSNISL